MAPRVRPIRNLDPAVKTQVDAHRQHAGFTIIEVLVAMVVLLVGVLATTTLLNTANAETSRNQARNGATNLVRDIIEASRALPYDQANPTVDANGNADNSLVTALQTMAPNGASATTSSFSDQETTPGWQITRRNLTYTVTLKACVVDDAKDKAAGSHTPANADGRGYYCPNPPATPTGDNNGDDYRRVEVSASWTSSTCNSCATTGLGAPRTYSVSQSSVIVNPTGGLGPTPLGPPSFANPVDCRTITIRQQYPSTTVAVDFNVQDPDQTSSNQTVPTAVDATTGA